MILGFAVWAAMPGAAQAVERTDVIQNVTYSTVTPTPGQTITMEATW